MYCTCWHAEVAHDPDKGSCLVPGCKCSKVVTLTQVDEMKEYERLRKLRMERKHAVQRQCGWHFPEKNRRVKRRRYAEQEAARRTP